MNYQCKLRGKRCPFLGSLLPLFKIKIYCHSNRKLPSITLNFSLGVIGVLLFVGSLLQLNSGVLAAPTKQPRRALGACWNYTLMSTGSPVSRCCLSQHWHNLPGRAVLGAEHCLGWSVGSEQPGAGGKHQWALITCYLSPMDLAVCDPRARLELHAFRSDYWKPH